MIFQKIKVTLNKFSFIFFGNSLGVIINTKWSLYYCYCCIIYFLNKKNEKYLKNNEFDSDRLCIINKVEIHNLSNKVKIYFNQLNSSSPHSDMDQTIQLTLSELIYDVLKKSELKIVNSLGFFFQPYWIVIQESKPGEEIVESSDSWHIDDNPKSMHKIFIYLNNVYSNNGAFRAFPFQCTKKFLNRGFKSNNPQIRRNNQTMVNDYLSSNPNKLKILEGEAGTILLFDNNLVHKGTLPLLEYRHVVQVLIYPSITELKLNSVKSALISKRRWDYPLDPFFNDYGGLLKND